MPADTSWFTLRGQLDGGTSGTSPDIILGGPKPDPKFKDQYDAAFNAIGNFGGSNYVYVRARNTGTELGIGNVTVYAARAGSIQNRGEWLALHTADARPNTNIWAPAGQVGMTGAPLIWEPGAAPPPDHPWCLVAEIDGDHHPTVKVPSTVKDRAGFEAWIARQPRMAYLVVQAPKVVPVEAPTFGWTRKVTVGNDEPATLSVSLTCTRGPAGGSLAYSFDQNDGSGKPIGVGTTKYQLNNIYSQTRQVPADFTSTLSVAYTPAGDDDAAAEFTLQVATETDGGDDDELGTGTTTVVASYTLSFGQAHRGA
ncbi:MAG TPA: hypothetical protein VF613_25655 [Longimicrobium sp.]|jgi:hypothetical protein